MYTKEFVIDDETMEVLKSKANGDGLQLEFVTDKYIEFITDLLKRVPPELSAIQRKNSLAFDLAVDFDWKEEYGNELYNKYFE
jgi:hypothetical protein